MTLIAINGLDRSGKDTAAHYLRETQGAITQFSFADKMKESLCKTLRMSREELEEFKDHGEIVWRVGNKQWTMTGREFIRWFATQGHREVFGEDFWVKELEAEIDQALPGDDFKRSLVVIPDLRFESEAQWVRSHGGFIWQVVGRGVSGNGDYQFRQGIDRVIDNSKTLHDFYKEVEDAYREVMAFERD